MDLIGLRRTIGDIATDGPNFHFTCEKIIGHGGGFGFSSVTRWYSEAQLAVVGLTNSEPTNVRR